MMQHKGFVLVFITTCILLFVQQHCTAQPMTLIRLSDPEAICNDGSQAGYYFRPGNLNRWNIHQQGGAWCWNESTCAERFKSSPSLMSSKSWAPTLSLSGLFAQDATNNPDWYDSTKVFIAYCSSDSFSGNRPASASSFHWHFKGKAILRAVIKDVLNKGLATAQHVLFSGCSAGGSAVFANLDFVSHLLPHLPNRVFKGHADAGFFLLTKPRTNIPAPYETIFKEGRLLWNGTSNENCETKFGPRESWRCYLGQFSHPFIQTGLLIFEESEDWIQLWRNDASQPWNKEKLEYVEWFRGNMTKQLEEVKEPHAVFSPACYWHCGTEEATFWDIKLRNDRVSDREVLGKWFFGHLDKTHWIDNCGGFNCSI